MLSRRRLNEARASLLHYLQQGFTPSRLASAVALGIFIAFIPMVGVHSGLAFFLAWLLRVNPVVVFIGTQISNPLTFPLQLVISVQTGHLLLYGTLLPLTWSKDIDWMGALLWPALLGSLVLALLCSGLTYLLAYRFLCRRAVAATEQAVDPAEHSEKGPGN